MNMPALDRLGTLGAKEHKHVSASGSYQKRKDSKTQEKILGSIAKNNTIPTHLVRLYPPHL